MSKPNTVRTMFCCRRLFFIFFLLGSCTSTSIITVDKPLSDGHANVLVSAGESFVLGFFSPGNSSRRYVGIWYNKVSEQTVVWVANRNNPITNNSGVLSLDKTGNLVLFDSRKPDVVVWSTNVSSLSSVGESNYSAELLDTGNLVVHDSKNKGFVWQSFDFPTDTLLPDMKFGVDRRSGLNRFLTSWKSSDNPEAGSYSYMIDINGSVPQLFLYKDKDPFWRGGSWNGLRWTGVPELRSNFIFKVSYVDNAEEVSIVYGMLNASIISRMVLNESTGTIQRSTWHPGDHRWDNFWSAPQDQCDYYSHCGVYGDCSLYNSGEYECKCLPGFEPKSPRDWYLRDGSQGCVLKQNSQLCRNGEGFVKLAEVKLPDTTKTKLDMNLGNKACAELCLKNCSCTGYSGADVRGSGFSGCITWYDKLVDLREYSRGGQDFYIRVDAVELAKNSKKSKRIQGYVKVLVPVLLSAVIFVLFALAYWLITKRKKDKLLITLRVHRIFFILVLYKHFNNLTEIWDIALRRKEGMMWFQNDTNKRGISVHGSSIEEEVDEIETSNVDVKFYSLSTIIDATENFSLANKVGEGGFGSVYKGKLRNGQEIAVKRLSNTSGQGIEEFRNEVTLIAKLQHRNLVRLFGYCIQREEKMLIYEYLPNKGLDCFLFDKEKKSVLDWKKRFDITLGIARGMVYLHHDSRLRIIHRDLKASNVLLDLNLNPKISDFGMARIFGNNQIEETTRRVVGTYGYMSPEYAMEGLFSIKSDVFSFGVMLLEIITGRKNSSYQSENFINMIGHVWDLWGESNALEIVDPALGNTHEYDTEILRCIHIALLCVQESAAARPSMSEVVFMLCNEISLQPPGQAAFLLRTANRGLTNTSSGSVGGVSVNDYTISTVEGR